jgi:hypothetical protein
VFSKDDPYCGIDLDHCRDPKTGKIAKWAEKIIQDFHSYVEVSPSGSGVHILVKGQLPQGGKKKGQIEVYDKLRFFTITGQHLEGTPQDIRSAQEAIDRLLLSHFSKEIPPTTPNALPRRSENDADLIQKAIESKNGNKFNLLYQGRWKEAGYHSQSEADQALCNLLAFWTGSDAAKMDSIFRQSALMRPKWNEKHYGDGRTYGQGTIEQAISECHKTYSGTTILKTKSETIETEPERPHSGPNSTDQDNKSPYSVIDIYEFLAMELPPRDNILAPWLPRQGLAMIHSKRGIGKTFMALNIAYAVACGAAFLRWEASQPAGVLYIDGEMPGNVIQERLAQIVKSNELVPEKALLLMSPDLQEQAMPDLSTSEGQKAVNGYLSQDIELIILDNISTLSRSGKENEAQSWLPLQEWALRLRAQGKSILFIHHSGKTGLQRGTSKKEDILDTVINLRHTVDYEPMQGACFEIHFEKSRGIYGADVEPFEVRLEDGLWTMKDLKTSTLEKVIRLTKDGCSQKEIAEELGKNKGYISRLVKQAKESGALS